MNRLPETAQTPDNRAGEISLQLPASEVGIAQARERAFQRLYEERVADRARANESREIRRRDFVRAASLGVIATLSFGSTVRTMVNATPPRAATSTDPRSSTAPLVFATSRAGSFVWENILFQVGQWAFAMLAQEHKLPIGNASMAVNNNTLRQVDIERAVRLYEKNPSQTFEIYNMVGVVGPIVEEAIFRVLPSLITSSPGIEWRVGIPFNVIYALMHSVVPESAVTKLSIPISNDQKISLDHLPISQFLLGAFCWYCARSYGSLAPILTHTLNNQFPAIVLAWGGKETYERFQTLCAEELARGGE